MEKKSLPGWMETLEQKNSKRISLGLDRCKKVKKALGVESIGKEVITVAGTNGKGSSIALLESFFLNYGYTVGTYTSPHLFRYNERVRINGQPVLDERLTDAFRKVEAARGDIDLTYFEFSTLAAFLVFEKYQPDIVFLEVGLGGRLDAVNSIDPDFCLITSIDLDHQEYLGRTRHQIAIEKAGIMRKNAPCVCSDPVTPISLLDTAQEVGCHLKLIGSDFHFKENEGSWDWWDENQRLEGLPKLPLRGTHQVRNAAGVLELIVTMGVSIDTNLVKKSIAELQIAGRFQELFAKNRKIILDVAHNPQSAKALSQNLSDLGKVGKIYGIVILKKSKDVNNFLSALKGTVDFWIFPTVKEGEFHSGLTLENELKKIEKKTMKFCVSSLVEGFDLALTRSNREDVIVACGSFTVVEKFVKYLENTL